MCNKIKCYKKGEVKHLFQRPNLSTLLFIHNISYDNDKQYYKIGIIYIIIFLVLMHYIFTFDLKVNNE